MCERKPGPRCSKHTREKLVKVESKYTRTHQRLDELSRKRREMNEELEAQGNPSDEQLAELDELEYQQRIAKMEAQDVRAEFYVAHRNYYSSPAGIKEYENALTAAKKQLIQSRHRYEDAQDGPTGDTLHGYIKSDERAVKDLEAKIENAQEQRAYERRALNAEKEREDRMRGIERGIKEGDKEQVESLLKQQVNTLSEIDVNRIRTNQPKLLKYNEDSLRNARNKYGGEGIAEGGMEYDVDIPHGGTGRVYVVRTALRKDDGSYETAYQTFVWLSPEDRNAPDFTRKGFGTASPVFPQVNTVVVPLSLNDSLTDEEKRKQAEVLDRKGFDKAANVALQNELNRQEQAYASNVATRYKNRK